MRILALETSTGSGSVALLDGDQTVLETHFADDQRTARTFAVALDEALRKVAWTPRSIQLVAVTDGPGSFTGLRIGVTAARFFAYAAGAALLPVNTLDVIVEQLPRDVSDACALVDAQRGQWFAGWYRRGEDGRWQVVEPCRLWDREELAARVTTEVILTGPGLGRSAAPFVTGEIRADTSCWLPRAATVGTVAWRAYQRGERGDLWRVEPRYYRPSYAEEKRAAAD